MAKPKLSRAVKLTGTDVPDGKKRTLTAGPITAVLDNGSLRYIRYHGKEVLRGIAYLLRDKNWGTYAPAIEGLKVKQGKDGFSVSYSATCKDDVQSLRYDVKIEASAKGTVRFAAHGMPLSDFLTNRSGFVVLHPLVDVVGAPVEIVHTDGKKKKSRFPKFISPGQPVFEIRSLKHEVTPGVTATVLMEGNKFEMEDHRNWMDASYKTYVCSLLDPWPYTLKKGEAFDQSITVTIEGKPRGKAAKAGGNVEVTLGGPKGRIPAIGAGVPMAHAAEALAKAELVAAASPAHLVCQIDGRQAGASKAAAAFRDLKARTGKPVTLEIILPAKKPAAEEVAEIAKAVKACGLAPDRIVVTQMHDLKSFQPNTPRPWGPTYEEMAAAIRAHFPGVPLGGGMLSFFTELNRKPTPKGVFDFVTHTVCPIVHAADDTSVMETLESMPSIIASARNIMGKVPYHLGPSSIACRDNPYGAAVARNPGGNRVCLSDVDPRQRALFAAAWSLGLAATAARGGIDVMSIGSFTGPQGAIAPDGDAGGLAVFPVYQVLAGLGAASGVRRREALSSAPAQVETLAHDSKAGPVLWLANLTPEKQVVKVRGFAAKAHVHLLNDATFGAITAKSGYLKGVKGVARKVTRVELGPYAVARISAA
ncbi:MAG: hypothetical protein LCH46_01055 [Proteobacteria bacterium]|nr:hypothetical protein [Pseudomonadota bacterium]